MMNPQPGGMEPILVPEEPSPWWHWGPAIGIIVLVLLTVTGMAIAAILPYDSFMDRYSEPQQPGPYPENGSTEEQSQWNNSNKEYADCNHTNKIFDSKTNKEKQ